MKPSEIVISNIPNRDKFGVYLKGRMKELDIKRVELAQMLDVSPSYIQDIEKGNRSAPKNHIHKLIKILEIEESEMVYFIDLFGCYNENWEDLNKYLFENPMARKAIRIMRDNNIPAEVLKNWIDERCNDSVTL